MRQVYGFFIGFLLIIAGIIINPVRAQDASYLRVYSSNGVREILQELKPDIEHAVGVILDFEFSTSRTLADQVSAGASFDVVVLTPTLIDELIGLGIVNPLSRSVFAQVGVGIGSHKSAPTKNVSTLDAYREILLEAESIAYGANGQSRRTNESSFEVLGISEQVHHKRRLTGPGEGPGLVAEGEVELVLTLVSELIRETDVQFLGPLPMEVQGYIRFEAGIGVESNEPVKAMEFIRFLLDSDFSLALSEYGLESINR